MTDLCSTRSEREGLFFVILRYLKYQKKNIITIPPDMFESPLIYWDILQICMTHSRDIRSTRKRLEELIDRFEQFSVVLRYLPY